MVIDRKAALEKVRKGIKESFENQDHSIIHSINTAEELTRVINLMYERLDEWYKTFFPEIKINNIEQYCRIVQDLDLNNPQESKLSNKVITNLMKKTMSRAEETMGAELGEGERAEIVLLAKRILEVISLRKHLNSYAAAQAQEIAPNLTHLLGGELTARLISAAGGLKKMGIMPASTIQILGAEKALFKHLRSGSRPPKHGLIFQLPQINKAPLRLRGRISRLYAGKLAMATRADVYTRNFIADDLKLEIEDKIKKMRRR